MQFPLDILTGYLHEHGFAVLKDPKHPKSQFSWVSAFPDDDAPLPADIVRVTSGRDADGDGRAHAGRIIVLGPEEDPPAVPALGNEDIHVRCPLSPAALADRIQRYLMAIIQWNDEMGDMLEEGCITQDLLKASEPVLRCYVALSDSTFSYIAHTPNIAPLDERSAYFISHGHYSPDSIRLARERGLMRTWETQEWTAIGTGSSSGLLPYPSLNRVIRLHGSYAAHLLMVSPVAISASQVFLFNLLARKVEACLERHWRLENPLEQSYTYFLKEILLGNAYDEAQLAERAELHGLPLTGIFELCLVDSSRQAGSPNYFAKMILEASPSCKVALSGSRVAVLLCAPDDRRGRIAGLEEQVFELVHRLRLEVGVSERFSHLGQAALALEKARVALKYGRRISRRYLAFDPPGAGTEEVFRFRRYFPYYATDPYAHAEKFVAKLLASPTPLAKLREADRERGTNDYEILRVYLRNEGRAGAVCDAMHLHRNTLAYRLEKIRALIGADLDDPDLRMYLRVLYLLGA